QWHLMDEGLMILTYLSKVVHLVGFPLVGLVPHRSDVFPGNRLVPESQRPITSVRRLGIAPCSFANDFTVTRHHYCQLLDRFVGLFPALETVDMEIQFDSATLNLWAAGLDPQALAGPSAAVRVDVEPSNREFAMHLAGWERFFSSMSAQRYEIAYSVINWDGDLSAEWSRWVHGVLSELGERCNKMGKDFYVKEKSLYTFSAKEKRTHT
ncbi:hypothetical protein HDU93_006320, partial [Gonapodya sp. JEL0774]